MNTVNKNVFSGFIPSCIGRLITKKNVMILLLMFGIFIATQVYFVAKSTKDMGVMEGTTFAELYNLADIKIKLSAEASIIPIVRLVPMNQEMSVGIDGRSCHTADTEFEFGSGGTNPSPVLGFCTVPREWWDRLDTITYSNGQKIILIFV